MNSKGIFMRNQTKLRSSGNRTTPNDGFSLIEVLVVVAIILLLAAIAIPNFIQAKMRANESAAVQNLRNITTAQVVYSTTYGIGFASTLPDLGGTAATVDQNSAELIDEVLASGSKTGYLYSLAVLTTDTNGNVIGYSVNADPQLVNNTGIRHFYTDQTGVIRANLTSPAGPTDAPI